MRLTPFRRSLPHCAAPLALAAALAGLAGCGGSKPDTAPGAPKDKPTPATSAAKGSVDTVLVGVARARPVSGGSDVVATGAFRREREIDLSFRIPGVLRQINFREGDVVAAGAVVAAVDPTGVQAQVASAQAQAAQAAAGIGQAQEQARA